jgi:hypothetical protein
MRREIFLVTIRDVCVIWQVGLIQNGFINGNSIEISHRLAKDSKDEAYGFLIEVKSCFGLKVFLFVI